MLACDDGSVNILVIEDDRRLAELIARRLRTAGHVAETCDDGSAGLERASTNDLDLAIVDVMLPGMDGVSLTRTLSTRGVPTPILTTSSNRSLSTSCSRGWTPWRGAPAALRPERCSDMRV